MSTVVWPLIKRGEIGASAAKVPRARKGHTTACTDYINPRFGPYGEKIAYIAGEDWMRSTDEDVIAERRHEELTQMKLLGTNCEEGNSSSFAI